jgi:hypothetical protein
MEEHLQQALVDRKRFELRKLEEYAQDTDNSAYFISEQEKRNFIASYIRNTSPDFVHTLYEKILLMETLLPNMSSTAHHDYVTGRPVYVVINLSHFVKQLNLPLDQQYKRNVANIETFNAQTLEKYVPTETGILKMPFRDFFVDVKYINLNRDVRTIRINLSKNPGWSGVIVKPHGFTLFPNGDDRRVPLNGVLQHDSLVPFRAFEGDKLNLIGAIVMYHGIYLPLHGITGKIEGYLSEDRVVVVLERKDDDFPIITQKIIAQIDNLKILYCYIMHATRRNVAHGTPRRGF